MTDKYMKELQAEKKNKETRSMKKIEKRQVRSMINNKLTENDDEGAKVIVTEAAIAKTAIATSYKISSKVGNVTVKTGALTGKIVTGKVRLDKDTSAYLKSRFKVYHPVAYTSIKATKITVVGARNLVRNIANANIGSKVVKGYTVASIYTKRTIRVVRKASVNNRYRANITKEVSKKLKTGYHASINNVKGLQTKVANSSKAKLRTAIKTVQSEVQLAQIYAHGVNYKDKKSYLYAKQKFVQQGRYIKNNLQTAKTAVLHTKSGKILTGTVHAGVYTGVALTKKIEKTAFKASDRLVRSNDIGAKTIGMQLKTIHYGAKLASKTASGVKTGVKVQKQVLRTAKSIKKEGVKKIAKKGAKAVKKKAKDALIMALKKLASKLLVPIIGVLIIVLILVIASAGIAGAVAAIFSPFFNDSDTKKEIDETVFLTQQITNARNDLIDEVKKTYNDNLVENGGEYHYIRFYNIYNAEPILLTDENIYESIYSVNEYLEYIQPVFHTILMSEYGLNAKESEYKKLFKDIWDYLSVIETQELPTEYCNNGVKDTDGHIHAFLMYINDNHLKCPNPTTDDMLYHPDNASAQLCNCDYYYYNCKGHTNYSDLKCGSSHHSFSCYDNGVLVCSSHHSHHDSCYGTYSHNMTFYDCGNADKHLRCEGYKICNGHRIMKLEITLKNFGDLLNKYFLDEINELKGKASLTEEEKLRLQELEDNYEICTEYIEILMNEFGLGSGSGVVVELDASVTLNDITAYAVQFVGNPYVLGGNDPNTGVDCSGFTKYVYANFGVYLPRTAATQANYGQAVYSLADAQPGDLIFFSDNGVTATHVTMYLGGNQIVHASNSKPYPKGGIKISNIYDTIFAIRRIAT